MSLIFYNTKVGCKVPFKPIKNNHVKMYVCGITSYDYCHIGHARSALVFDMIVRYLKYRGYQVTYIRNFTDIDDKIIKRAQERNITTAKLTEYFIKMFQEDMKRLGVEEPDSEPKATDHIPEIIEIIQKLIAQDLAYQVSGDVYFRVNSFKDYGDLSGRNLEDMLAGSRIAVNETKEHPMDFALWKSSKPDEPTWDSPWGAGRPGWHVECSAMSRKYLGDTIDIHGGGKDLIFPHHENEVAQSEGATGKPFTKAWIHHGFVTIKGEKMSKSSGNFLIIREVLDRYPAEGLRLFMFLTHYRSPLDYSTAAIEDAVAGLNRLYNALAEIALLTETGDSNVSAVVSKKDRQTIESLTIRFEKAMDNDFNTAQALAQLFEAAKTLNRMRQALPLSPAAADLSVLQQGGATIKRLANIIGLLHQDPVKQVQERREFFLHKLDIDKAEIDQLICARNEARQQKNWTRADEIRDQLLSRQIELKDGASGTTWAVTEDRG